MKQKRGRKGRIEEWTTEERILLLKSWAREGYTNKMFAERMGISTKTLYEWCNRSEEIKEAIRQGKELVDYKVENALLKAALGYEVTETKTYISGQDKEGNRTVKIEKTTKQIPPNVTAIAMWLNNRKPEMWRRNRDNVLELKDDEKHITVNIVKSSEAKANKENKIDNEQIVSEENKKSTERNPISEKLEPYRDSSEFEEFEEEDTEEWGNEIYNG